MRRMVLHKIEDLDTYARYLSNNPQEVKALYADILIHVTGFFRDPEAFEAMGRDVLSNLLKDRPPGVPIRVWVLVVRPARKFIRSRSCSRNFWVTGFLESAVQIFASDISEQAIQKARVAEYSEGISGDVNPERLHLFHEDRKWII